MKKALSLSIVLPVYNEELHLKRCLDAIARQREMPDEVIVVDNNSTDDTVKIAKQYSFVRLLKEKKQGVLYARTTGFNAANSEIIARIDADTILPPTWTRSVKGLLENPHYAVVTGPVYYYEYPWPHRHYKIDHCIRKGLYDHFGHAPFLFGSNAALRASAWEEVKKGLCDRSDVHEDLDLAIHLYHAGLKIHYDERMLAGVSARRGDDNVAKFRVYLGMYLNSYRVHRIGLFGPRIATSLYWLGYLTLRPIRLAYDDRTQRHSWQQLFKRRKARKNPMH
jgi:glycosyltransferase involved in cell wall biosynthesis